MIVLYNPRKRGPQLNWFVVLMTVCLLLAAVYYFRDDILYYKNIIPFFNALDQNADYNDEKSTEKKNEQSSTSLTDNSDQVLVGDYYSIILKQLMEHKSKITFATTPIEAQGAFDLFPVVCNDHPELFFLSGGATGQVTTVGATTKVDIVPDYIVSLDKIDEMNEALEREVEDIIANAELYESDLEKIKYVHDRIIATCEYDIIASSLYLSENGNPTKNQAYTSYGCLVEKKAVCEGYSRAFQLVMNRLGIECGFVSGAACNSVGDTGRHAWNYVKVDGEYKYCDLTFDDPYTGGAGLIMWDYFCISKEEMGRDHFPDSNQKYP